MSLQRFRLMMGDCLELMRELPDGSVDMVLCDLPYGTTKNQWDCVIPLDRLWSEYFRITKLNAPIVLTAAQPFTTALISSQIENFRYALVWDKVGTTGFQLARKQPLRRHEDICIFYRKMPSYNPIMETRGEPRRKGGSKTDNGCYGDLRSLESFNNTYYPTSVLQFSNAVKIGKFHPTQKPVPLGEYLIKTYSNSGDVVLDNAMGSGSFGVSAMISGRRFIGMERDEKYFSVAQNRIEAALSPSIEGEE